MTASTTTDDTDTGWKFFAGYQLTKNFAVAAAYADFGKFTARSIVTTPSASVVDSELKADAWTLAAVGILPLNDNFSLFGKIGINAWNIDINAGGTGAASVSDSSDGTDWPYGVGASYKVAKNLNLRAEWECYDLDGNDLGLVSVGVAYHF